MPFLLSTSPGSRILKGPTALQLVVILPTSFIEPLLQTPTQQKYPACIRILCASMEENLKLLLHPQLFSVNLKNTISLNVSLKIDHPFPVA